MPPRAHISLVASALVALAVLGWLYLAPTQIGGSTSYVITHGNSMVPRFHSGDLALVRPADRYRVGEIVAYRSTLLHVVVLHRIIGRDGGRFVLKGDNNDFVDPTHPTRADLLGSLWVAVPHGGRVLAWLHTPFIAAVLLAGCATLLLIGTGERRRRRRRRPAATNASGRPGASPVATHNHDVSPITDQGLLLAGGAGIVLAVIAALAVGVIAFTRPLHRATTVKIPYTQRVIFGYSAAAPAGPVYPDGAVRTGDPVFVRLVRKVNIRTTYGFTSAAPHSLKGSDAVAVQVSGAAGWKRTIQVTGPRRFTGDHVTRTVTVDLRELQSLLAETQSLTGMDPGGGYTLTVIPHVHIGGRVAGQTFGTSYAPSLSFQLNPLELQLGSTTSASAGLPSGLTPSVKGTVASPATTSNTLDVAGFSPTIATLRWASVALLVLAVVAGLTTLLLRRRRPSDPAARIQARYGELIVPIAALNEDPAHSPIDVTNIKALAKLAESGQRLILHHHGRSTDTYLVEDAGTIYRYQTASTAPLQESEVAEDWTTPDEIPAQQQPTLADGTAPEWDDTPGPLMPEPLPPEPLSPEPLTPEPLPPEPVAPELNGAPRQNGSSERPLSHVPPAWRALAILAGDDVPAPVPAPPELPSTFARSVWRPRRPR